MATVRRFDGEPQTLEAFEIDLDEGDWFDSYYVWPEHQM